MKEPLANQRVEGSVIPRESQLHLSIPIFNWIREALFSMRGFTLTPHGRAHVPEPTLQGTVELCQEREGEMDDAFLGQRPRFIPYHGQKAGRKLALTQAGSSMGTWHFCPWRGPSQADTVGKTNLSSPAVLSSAPKFCSIHRVWTDQNFLLKKKIQRPPSESWFNFWIQAM